MAENKIVINGDVYTDSEIISGNAFLSNSLACDELTIDTLDTSVTNTSLLGTLFIPKDASSFVTSDNKTLYVMPKIRVEVTNPVEYEYGTLAYYYHDNKLVGKFYVSEVERTGKNTYTISCVSAIGLLDTTTHYGGMYTGQSVQDVVEDIVGGVVPCTVMYPFANQSVYGYLPIDTRRNNLHQLLFAMGASVFKFDSGNIYIDAMEADNPEPLGPERIYLEGSVEQNKKIKRVIVTEHAYTAYDSDAETVLYEGIVESKTITTPNGNQENGALLQFDSPMHDLKIEGATILESNVNYAVVSPTPMCKLTGKAYTHTTRQIIRENNTSTQSVSVQIQDNDAVVDNATLVSVANSNNVADRVMSYYSSAKKVKAGIVKQQADKPGMRVSFDDTFGDPVTGYVKSMDITLSGILKADSEVIVGYTPTESGNNYNNVTILTPEREWDWTVPPNTYRLLLVLIGGGDGGASGARGQDGANGGSGGDGGVAGQGGNGGKVLVQEISVTPGQTFHFKAGFGGTGGVYANGNGESVAGIPGTASTFGTYSSNDGVVSTLGYSELFSGDLYAFKGKPGHDGGRGRDGGDATDLKPLEPDYDAYPGKTGRYYQAGDARADGGGGGGAAYYSGKPPFAGNGEDGGNATATISSGTIKSLRGGSGGNGKSGGKTFIYVHQKYDVFGQFVFAPEGAGCGGFGGNGGGGGGGGGRFTGSDVTGMNGYGGYGGDGGDGGDGVAGCAIIYY